MRPGDRGAVTVYFSFIMLLLAALIGAAAEGVRYAVIASRMPENLRIAGESVLAAYDSDLFEEYGILFFKDVDDAAENIASACFFPLSDAGYGLEAGGANIFSAEYPYLTVTEKYYAPEGGGMYFARQVTELMKYRSVELVGRMIEQLLAGENVGDEADALAQDAQQDYDSIEWEEGEEQTGNDVDEAVSSSLIGQIAKLIRMSVIELLLPGEEISDRRLVRVPEWDHTRGPQDAEMGWDYKDQLIFGEYILDSFGSFVSPSHAGGLRYEQEYIAYGRESDEANLLAALGALLGTRSAMNTASIMAEKELSMQADSVAEMLVGWTGIPGLAATVGVMLKGAWGFGEAVLDLRALLAGKRLPFIKSAKDMTSSLSTCFAMVTSGLAANSEGRGIGYDMYMRLLLYFAGKKVVTRTMQMIEVNMRVKDKAFTFDDMLYGVTLCGAGWVSPLFSPLYDSFVRGGEGGHVSARASVTY